MVSEDLIFKTLVMLTFNKGMTSGGQHKIKYCGFRIEKRLRSDSDYGYGFRLSLRRRTTMVSKESKIESKDDSKDTGGDLQEEL